MVSPSADSPPLPFEFLALGAPPELGHHGRSFASCVPWPRSHAPLAPPRARSPHSLTAHRAPLSPPCAHAGAVPWLLPLLQSKRRPCRARSSLRPPLFRAPSQSPSSARLAPGEPRRGHQPPCSGDLPAPPAPVVRPKERVLGTVAPAPVRATTARPCARKPQGPLGPMTWGPHAQNGFIKKKN